jgi:hypothetical protein
MSDVTRVRIPDRGFLFDGGDGDVVYSIESITGLDGVDMRRERTERPVGHGVFGAPGYMDGRMVMIEGRCHTTSPQQQSYERKRLSGLLAGGASERFVFDLPDGSVWGDFGRYGKPRFESEVYGELAQYQLAIFSPDPYLYGETHEFNANNGVTFTALHYGNTDAEPELQVFGNQGDPYTIEAQGKSFVVTQDLLPNQIHHIYPASGQLVIDGQVIAGGIAAAPVITVPAGVQTNFRLVSPTLSNLKVIVRDTYA